MAKFDMEYLLVLLLMNLLFMVEMMIERNSKSFYYQKMVEGT